jgi:hypothetical protein
MSQLQWENYRHVVLSKGCKYRGKCQPSVQGYLAPASSGRINRGHSCQSPCILGRKIPPLNQSLFSPDDTFLEIHMIVVGESYSAAEYGLQKYAISGVVGYASGN